jgi:L-fuconolactonase
MPRSRRFCTIDGRWGKCAAYLPLCMKIDTHQHYWRYQAQEFPWINEAMPLLQRDCMPVDCATARRSARVDAVVAVQARTLPTETDFLLDVADHNPEVIGVVGWADLAAPGLEQQLEKWAEHAAFKGLRHILQDEPDVASWVNAPAINQGLRALQHCELVYDVLVFDHQLPAVTEFCARHDQHWLVLDHMGKPALRDWASKPEISRHWSSCMRKLATLPHVVCKLSGAVTETDWAAHNGLAPQASQIILSCFDQALEFFGPQRLIFGSDWPVCQLAATYDAVYNLAHTWASTRLNLREQDAFWSGNAVRCYGLNVQAITD